MRRRQDNVKILKGKSFINKYIIIIAIFLAVSFGMAFCSYAENEGITIVKGENKESIIYIQNNESTNFEFAYTNDAAADKSTLTYETCAQDTLGNNIAYVNSTNSTVFSVPTYMYARIAGTQNYIVNGIKVDLSKQIDVSVLDGIGNITKQIPVDTDKSITKSGSNNGINTTLTQGRIILTDTSKKYEYIMVKASADSNYTNFLNIINLMSKFNNNTELAARIETYNAFSNEYDALKPAAADAKWISAANNEIIEPADTQTGDVYIVWIKDAGTNTIDMQIMTAKQEYSEEKIKQALAEELPITGESYTLLIIFGILAASVIFMIIARKKIKYFKNM